MFKPSPSSVMFLDIPEQLNGPSTPGSESEAARRGRLSEGRSRTRHGPLQHVSLPRSRLRSHRETQANKMMASFVYLNTSTHRSYHTAVENGARVSLLRARNWLGHPNEAAIRGVPCGWEEVTPIVIALPRFASPSVSDCVASTLRYGVLGVILCSAFVNPCPSKPTIRVPV